MRILDLANTTPKLKLLVYGASGSGKSTLVGSLLAREELNPCAYLSIDNSGIVLRNIPGIKAMAMDEPDDAFRFLEAVTVGSLKHCPTVVVDGMGAFLDLCLVHATEKKSGALDKRAKGEFVAPPSDIPFTLFNTAYTQMRNFTRAILALDRVVVVTTWVGTTWPKKKVGNSYERGEVPSSIHPSFPDKIRDNLVGSFDCVFFVQAGEKQHALLTRRKEVKMARVRDPNFRKNLEQVILDPDLSEIYQTYLDSQQPTK